MSTTGKKERKICLPERGTAWIATVLLALLLTVTVACTLAVRIMTSAGLHLSAAADESVVDEQQKKIWESFDLLAEEYGFSAEAVKAVVSREELQEANREVAAWWTGLLTEGKTEPMPRWYSAELEKAVSESMTANSQADLRTAVADLTYIVDRAVFPLRGALVSRGMEYVREHADVPALIRTMRKLPPLGFALCALAAGLIALLTGREIRVSLKHYGTALACAGFSLLTAGVTVLILQPKDMIVQVSRALAAEFSSLTNRIGLETAGIVLLLVAAGYCCLYLYRNGGFKRIRNRTEQQA